MRSGCSMRGFNPGMYEDNDYCRRIHLAGLKIGIHDGAFVDHSRLQPSFRASPTAGADLEACPQNLS